MRVRENGTGTGLARVTAVPGSGVPGGDQGCSEGGAGMAPHDGMVPHDGLLRGLGVTGGGL